VNVIWEVGVIDFVVVTIVLGGGAAVLAGRAVARGWQPFWTAALWMIPLAGGVRFIHFALFHGTLLSLHFYIVDLIVLIVAAFLGHRLTRVRQMTTRYNWMIEPVGRWSWRSRPSQ
jgi:hypothetical protein